MTSSWPPVRLGVADAHGVDLDALAAQARSHRGRVDAPAGGPPVGQEDQARQLLVAHVAHDSLERVAEGGARAVGGEGVELGQGRRDLGLGLGLVLGPRELGLAQALARRGEGEEADPVLGGQLLEEGALVLAERGPDPIQAGQLEELAFVDAQGRADLAAELGVALAVLELH